MDLIIIYPLSANPTLLPGVSEKYAINIYDLANSQGILLTENLAFNDFDFINRRND